MAGYNVYRGTADGGPYSMQLNSGLVPEVTFTDTDVVRFVRVSHFA